jgi:hypothetical protein
MRGWAYAQWAYDASTDTFKPSELNPSGAECGLVADWASFTSVEQLTEHIDAFIETYNEDAEPFAWTKCKVHQRRVKGQRISDL